MNTLQSSLPPCGFTPRNLEGCSYVRFQRSDFILQFANAILKPLDLIHRPLVYVHIRRTDSVAYCDTSLERMKAYLECTFGNLNNNHATTSAPPSLYIAFSSDEVDPTYRESFRNLTHGIENSDLEFLDMDDLAQTQLRLSSLPDDLNNNYWVYSLIEAVRDDAAITTLEQRRDNMCNDCDRDLVLKALQERQAD